MIAKFFLHWDVLHEWGIPGPVFASKHFRHSTILTSHIMPNNPQSDQDCDLTTTVILDIVTIISVQLCHIIGLISYVCLAKKLALGSNFYNIHIWAQVSCGS